MQEDKKIPLQSVGSLMNPEIIKAPDEEKVKEEKEKEKEDKKYFAERLQHFIIGLAPDDGKRQKYLLKIAVEQFAGTPAHKAKRNCKACYGNGFTGFDKVHEFFVPCHKCFKI